MVVYLIVSLSLQLSIMSLIRITFQIHRDNEREEFSNYSLELSKCYKIIKCRNVRGSVNHQLVTLQCLDVPLEKMLD